MDPLLLLLVLGGVIGAAVLAGAVAVALQRAAKRRQEELLALARDLGLKFDPTSRQRWDKEWPQFECFARGHSRRAFNLLTGLLRDANGSRCLLGDYEFKETRSTGKSTYTVTYRFGFLIIATRWARIPDVLVRHETMLDKLAAAIGFDDIDFESVEFSRKFMVKSRNKRFAYDLISPQMMEFLLQDGTPCIDIGGNGVCLWFGQNVALSPAQFRTLFDWAGQFLQRWPRMLIAQLDETHIGGRTSE